ncbi:hypothetical protein GDO81_012073 [Engystomops pustulosus]|uniref:Uncharacterized protein n=1 Tax=Engystomops pustulosus TaxID=76066 RepID=A0AAV7BIU5_ENGPU|nr:hypothetical protein GDO81_012073 [Engystomops pustulosus]
MAYSKSSSSMSDLWRLTPSPYLISCLGWYGMETEGIGFTLFSCHTMELQTYLPFTPSHNQCRRYWQQTGPPACGLLWVEDVLLFKYPLVESHGIDAYHLSPVYISIMYLLSSYYLILQILTYYCL